MQRFGLPARDSRNSEGRPFTRYAPKWVLKSITSRDADVVDVALLRATKKRGKVPAWFVVDSSQTPERAHSHWGGYHNSNIILIPACGSFESDVEGVDSSKGDTWKARHLSAIDYFSLQGWPGDLELEGLSFNNVKDLAGNMITMPCMNAVLAAVMFSVRLDLRRPIC